MTKPVTTGEHFTHATRRGERWDTLAWTYYANADLGHLIIDANRALFLDPLQPIPQILPSGLTLQIPVIESETVNPDLLPPWMRS